MSTTQTLPLEPGKNSITTEDWLFKTLHDEHHALLHEAADKHSKELTEGDTCDHFVRARWESSPPSWGIKKKEEIVSVSGKLMDHHPGLSCSDIAIRCEAGSILSKLMWLTGDSKDLNTENFSIFTTDYLKLRACLSSQVEDTCALELVLGGTPFRFPEKSLCTMPYKIDSQIVNDKSRSFDLIDYIHANDQCESLYMDCLRDDVQHGEENMLEYSSLARDIFYFGCSDAPNVIIYELNAFEEIANNRIKIISSLYRKRDEQLIAMIFSLKQVIKTENNKTGCST